MEELFVLAEKVEEDCGVSGVIRADCNSCGEHLSDGNKLLVSDPKPGESDLPLLEVIYILLLEPVEIHELQNHPQIEDQLVQPLEMCQDASFEHFSEIWGHLFVFEKLES